MTALTLPEPRLADGSVIVNLDSANHDRPDTRRYNRSNCPIVNSTTRAYQFWFADCFDPPVYTVLYAWDCNNFSDALETFLDWCDTHRPGEALDERTLGDYKDSNGDYERVDWSPNGRPYDAESLRGRELVLPLEIIEWETCADCGREVPALSTVPDEPHTWRCVCKACTALREEVQSWHSTPR